ncbi:nitrite reductase [Nocardioides antri]|uniref:Nitrite reductase n=1 Tax=Nocardioides antri TaxID=2607659 RepID=A0A5B1M3I7_9ACTN|nr:nitrite reductase [Nocardioides antri]KAA1426367.1 nitrite reductase [Nocardioides antri]
MRATDLRDPGSTRTRADRCPGVLRPWPAEDGGLARVRVPGGRLTASALAALAAVAHGYGDGRVRVTARANLQLRGLPLVDGVLPEEVVAAIEATGLLPSRAHDLARNVMVSPLTGLAGGRADLRPVAAGLDSLLLADPALAGLPGRFLFTLDDGRGDLADRHPDLGLVALDERTAQVRVGSTWGRVLDLADAPAALAGLALLFLDRRGSGPTAAWHVDELASALAAPQDPAPGAVVRSGPLPYGPVAGLTHVAVTDGIDRATAAAWAARTPEVVITPWHGVLV